MPFWAAVLLVFLFCTGAMLSRRRLLYGSSYRWYLAASLIAGALAALVYAVLTALLVSSVK
ncbi:MAG: hypothetical protein ACOX5A_01335 [Aminivibrio sp.]